MSDCLKHYLMSQVPFYALFLLLAHFGGGLVGWELVILGAVGVLCLAAEYPVVKRRWNNGN